MSELGIDLFLGGDLGRWALERVSPHEVRVVIAGDAAIKEAAERLGFAVRDEAPAGGAAALSVHYPKILPGRFLRSYRAAYNLHPGYLPWGRGYYPAFWALHDETPAGATLHAMTEQLDRGPIVEQIRVAYTEADTGGTLHGRIREAEKELFLRYWPRIAAGQLLPVQAQEGKGSYHARADFFAKKRPEHWGRLDAAALLRLKRCLSFPGYAGLESQAAERTDRAAMQDVNKVCMEQA